MTSSRYSGSSTQSQHASSVSEGTVTAPDVSAIKAVSFFVSNGAGMFGLWLLSQSAPGSTAREARRQLELRITERVVSHMNLEGAHDHEGADVRRARVTDAVDLVMWALRSCRSRDPRSFTLWLDQRIARASCSAPDGGPSGEARVLPFPTQGAILEPLPVPTDDAARLAAVLNALPSAERRVLELRAQRRGTSWSAVANRLGLSVSATQRLHRRALAMAREQALSLYVSAATAPHTGDAPRSA